MKTIKLLYLLMLTFYLSCSENDNLLNEILKKEISSFKISDLPSEERAKLLGDLIAKETSFKTAQRSSVNAVAREKKIHLGYKIKIPKKESLAVSFGRRIGRISNQFYNYPHTQNSLRVKYLHRKAKNGALHFLIKGKYEGEYEKLIPYGRTDYLVIDVNKDELIASLTSFSLKHLVRTVVQHKKYKLDKYTPYLLPYVIYKGHVYYIRNLEDLQTVINELVNK